jgi:hypothetical protein
MTSDFDRWPEARAIDTTGTPATAVAAALEHL